MSLHRNLECLLFILKVRGGFLHNHKSIHGQINSSFVDSIVNGDTATQSSMYVGCDMFSLYVESYKNTCGQLALGAIWYSYF